MLQVEVKFWCKQRGDASAHIWRQKLCVKLNGGKSGHARCKNSGNNQTCPFSIIAYFVFALSYKTRFNCVFISSCAALSIR